jgi:hypothetical protein
MFGLFGAEVWTALSRRKRSGAWPPSHPAAQFLQNAMVGDGLANHRERLFRVAGHLRRQSSQCGPLPYKSQPSQGALRSVNKGVMGADQAKPVETDQDLGERNLVTVLSKFWPLGQ